MIFVPFVRFDVGPTRARKEVSIAGAGHRVTVDGDEFVAACGARFGRTSDGAVYKEPALYRDRRCEACEEAKA